MRRVLGSLVAQARRRHGLSQRGLAVRAGITQASVSRIERGLESPSFARFEQILLAMGERPVVCTEPLALDADPAALRAGAALSPAERLREAASWNLVAGRLELAGAAARRAGHPATRRGPAA